MGINQGTPACQLANRGAQGEAVASEASDLEEQSQPDVQPVNRSEGLIPIHRIDRPEVEADRVVHRFRVEERPYVVPGSNLDTLDGIPVEMDVARERGHDGEVVDRALAAGRL